MTKEECMRKVCGEIERNKETLAEWADTLLHMPEQGFREYRSAEFVRKCMEQIGCEDIRTGMAETGVSGYLPGKGRKGNVVLMGELDAIHCPEHPFADPVTHVAHACGHHVQLIAILGAALGMKSYMNELAGRVTFMAVPCEEGIGPEYKDYLMQEKGFSFCGGKQEFIKRGYLEDVDAVLMMHTAPVEEVSVGIPVTSRSFVQLEIVLSGREAHTGGETHLGVNAMQCANLIINAVNASREAFPPKDMASVNVIVTEGGENAGNVPEKAALSVCVRAVNNEACERMINKLARIVHGCSYAMGVEAKIQLSPGYLSLYDPGYLTKVMKRNAEELVGKERVTIMDQAPNIMTDSGDMSRVVPTLQICIGGGFCGMHHRRDFLVKDEETAYVLPAKILARTAVDLLWGEGEELQEVKRSYRPFFTRSTYLEYWEKKKEEMNGAADAMCLP